MRGDRQTQAGAAETAGRGRIGLYERAENLPLLVGCDPYSGVGNREREDRLGVGHALGLHLDDHVAGLGEFDRVADEVEEHLAQTPGIADERVGHVGQNAAGQLETLGIRALCEELHSVFYGVAKAEWHMIECQPSRLDFRDVKDVVEDREQGFGRVVGPPDVFPLLWRELRAQREIGHADHRVHRRPDLVAHVREEFPLRDGRRFGLLPGHVQLPNELLEILRRFLQGLVRALAVRHITRHCVDDALIDEWRGGPIQPPIRSVARTVAVLEIDQARAGRQHRHRVGRRRTIVGMDEIEEGRRLQFRFVVAEHLRPGGIEPQKVAVQTGDAQQVE